MPTRGELWTVSGGVYSAKPRPALLIQEDAFSQTASITIIPLTTIDAGADLLRLKVVPSSTNGLVRPSWVEVDKITTVRRTNLGERIGRLTPTQMIDVERLVITFLGVAR